jgi:hypothetical protein
MEILTVRRSSKLLLMLLCVTAISWINPLKSAEPPQLEAGKGMVVFYRSSKFAGGAVRFNLNHAEGSIGQLLSGTWLYKSVDPGSHTFWSQAISQDSITITVEAGETYYVRGEVKMGVFVGRPRFTQVSEQEGLKGLAEF